MILFITLLIVYLVTGFVRLSREVNGGITEQTGWVIQGQYLKYILLWPLPFIANSGTQYLLDKALRDKAEKATKPSSLEDEAFFDNNFQEFRKGFKSGEREAIVTTLYVIASKTGQSNIDAGESKFIGSTTMLLGVDTNSSLFNNILDGKNEENFATYLNQMSEKNKEYFCTVVHGLQYSANKPDSFKTRMTSMILSDMGIDQSKFERVVSKATDKMNNNPYFKY